MKKVCLLVSLLLASASAHWINKSELMINPNQHPESGCEYVQYTAHQEMPFTLDNQKTMKWKIHPDQPVCTLSIVKGGAIIKSCVIDKGALTFKQLFEPGTYKILATSNARIEICEWRVHKMKAMVPVGGGAPAFIVTHNKKVPYFRAAPDTIPVLKIKGTTKAFIYVRVDVPEKETMRTLDVTVTDKVDGKQISHKTVSTRKSKKAVYAGNKAVVPGRALIITFDVPSGNHEYAVTLNGPHGVVKFYAEKSQNKTESQHRQRTIRW
jgi:hypothetical protein